MALSLFGTVPQFNMAIGQPHLIGSGTILCGMAPSMDALIIARAVAGMGGGG